MYLDNAVTLGGPVSVNGGTLAVSQSLNTSSQLTVGSSASLNMTGGSLVASEVVNQGTFNFSSGNMTANLNNLGTANLSGTGTRTITGDVTNQGTVYVHETSVVYGGNFTNNGADVSDPSTSTFNNLSVGPNGYISGGPQDKFIVTGNFNNASTQNTLWNTANSNLVFNSAPGSRLPNTRCNWPVPTKAPMHLGRSTISPGVH